MRGEAWPSLNLSTDKAENYQCYWIMEPYASICSKAEDQISSPYFVIHYAGFLRYLEYHR